MKPEAAARVTVAPDNGKYSKENLMPTEVQQRVYDLLHQMSDSGLKAAKQLFWTELNYERANKPLSRRRWPDRAREVLAADPLILAEHDDFHVLYAPLAEKQRGRAFPLSLMAERLVVNQLLKDHPYALFVFSDTDERHWHLVNVRYDPEIAGRRLFRRIAIGPHERLRTASERIAMLDLATISPDLFGLSPLAIQQRHDEAFDVEAVTREFFRVYRNVFERLEGRIEGLQGDARRLFAQKFFNRLMFIIFLERKGWLSFDHQRDYLRALWEDHRRQTDETDNFYRHRLKLLFFSGLNTPHQVNVVGIRRDGFLQTRIGHVPYLNGGLFEEEEDDRNQAITVPDQTVGQALDELFYHFNFTVTESTPLDMEVAVDPEMLGKIFEELVTGRHETGSYYTPKTVVAFMGREALKGYLQSACSRDSVPAIAAFVDERDPVGLRNAEAVLEALRRVTVCDPACGSGAYLLGMLHELLELRTCLFNTRGLDALTTYQRKLEIIQRNLYGVDIDPFAVNIARLRLWLSLMVDFEGDDPPPLPNLDFKIEVGDSLTAPDPSGGLQPDFHHRQIEEYFRLKTDYLMAHGHEKLALRQKIDDLRAEIAAWVHSGGGSEGFDWAVEFAEVFAPPLDGGGRGGFDIVLANPPYVRQELLGRKYKEKHLKPIYPQVYAGTADIYVYFYARACQLLKPEGVACFISSNKWMRAGYGKKMRRHLAENTTLETVIDFGDLPIFEATTYPCITVIRRAKPPADHTVKALTVDDLSAVQHLSDTVRERAWPQPQASLRPQGWALVRPEVLSLLEKLRRRGTPLGEYVNGRFYRGIVTGLNKAFVIDQATRDRLIAQDPNSAEIIKPWLRGRDVKRWRVEWARNYLIWAYQGIAINDYPAVLEYLAAFKDKLAKRWEPSRGQCEWYELRPCDYYVEFDNPKIIYPDIANKPEFAYDTTGAYGGNTMYFLPTDELYLLGVLNSRVVEFFYNQISPTIRGDYLRFFTEYMQQVPIPSATSAQRAAIESLVGRLLEAGGQGPQVKEWERELNALVYQVYGLTEEEMALIEGMT